MKVKIGKADLRANLVPDPPEPRTPQRPTLRTHEHTPIRTRLCELVHVDAQLRDDLRGKRDNPPTSPRLGRALNESAAIELGQRADDAHHSPIQVEMDAAKLSQLTPSQACEGAQEHERPIALRNLAEDLNDLG
jgi:hypothetical protein